MLLLSNNLDVGSITAPVHTYTILLIQLIDRNKTTVYGRENSFPSVTDRESYQRLVPVVGYEVLRPYVERTKQGEENVIISVVTRPFTLP